MASSINEIIMNKVNNFLYPIKTENTFLVIQNRLVGDGVLSAEQLEQHHDTVRDLYRIWHAGILPQHDGNHQPQPLSPPTSDSLSPQVAPPKTSTSSPTEDDRAATVLDRLKEAVEKTDPSVWPPKAPAITGLLIPGDPNHLSAAVNRKETSCAWSYIQARTLEKNKIKWKGSTINLQWKSLAITPGRDECVQSTCFLVVEETLAREAGFSFDMLVGADHGLPLRDQIQALEAEETSSAGSSVVDQTEDLSAHYSEGSRSAELRPITDAYHTPPPADQIQISLSGSSHGMASFFKELGASGGGISKAMAHPTGRLIDSHNPGYGKRKLSYSDDSGGPSRKNRPAGE